jgi:hypothetical protein
MTTTRMLDNGNVAIHVDFSIRRVANRRRLVFRDAENVSVARPMLAKIGQAKRWAAWLEEGRYATVSDLAHALDMDRSNLVRELGLAWVSPRIVRAISTGIFPEKLSLCSLYAMKTLDWKEQERLAGIDKEA